MQKDSRGLSWLYILVYTACTNRLALEKNQDGVVKRESEGRRGQRKREVAVARHRGVHRITGTVQNYKHGHFEVRGRFVFFNFLNF